MGSNPTVTAMETPEKSGVFPYPGRGVGHVRWAASLRLRGVSNLALAIWVKIRPSSCAWLWCGNPALPGSTIDCVVDTLDGEELLVDDRLLA